MTNLLRNAAKMSNVHSCQQNAYMHAWASWRKGGRTRTATETCCEASQVISQSCEAASLCACLTPLFAVAHEHDLV
eukprot:4594938-Amphidinium_carterae.1